MNKHATISVLFVCMGNICRSPTAEGVFRHFASVAGLIETMSVDSAGTHAYHTGEPPDRRSRAAAERRGYSLERIRARRVTAADFDEFDLILAMDRDNLANLKAVSDDMHHGKIRLFLDYTAGPEDEVPDPYYGGATGFERVLDLIEEASRQLIADISRSR